MLAAQAAALALPSAPAAAAEPAASALPGYVLPETEAWDLSSESGEPYRIFVSKPKEPAPAEGYAVLYVLDGQAMFAGFAETRRIHSGSNPDIANAMVVGVGYPTDQIYDNRRLYDFTPPRLARVPPMQARLAHRAGGNDRFLEFLLDRLRPELDRRYRIDPNRQALFGHSLGGLFALHALYTRPDAFNAIIAASPSIWWNDQGILAEERAFTARLTQSRLARPPSRLLLLAGALEERQANVWDADALARRLEPLSAYGLRSRYERLEDEIHISVPSRAVTTTLRFAFARP